MSVVLIGYRGSGKTTLGRALAGRLGWHFHDSDEWIVNHAGLSIRETFEQQGEPAFRSLESAAIQELLAAGQIVLSLGGGAIERESNRALLRRPDLHVIYLRCDPAELLRRIQGDPATAAARPALTALGGGIEEIRSVLTRREPIYRKAMADELDVTDLTPQQAVDALHKIVRARTR